MTLIDEIIEICHNHYDRENHIPKPTVLLLPFEREADFAKLFGLSIFSQKKKINCDGYVLSVYRSLDIDELMVF